MDNREPVEVYSGTISEVAILKSLLDNAEVEAYVTDEIMGMLNPWWTNPGGASPIRVFVAKDDFEKANIVVQEFLEKHKESSSGGD